MSTLPTFRRIPGDRIRRAACEALECRRLLAAGALDPSFAGDGTETIDFFGDGYAGAYATDVAVQRDGKTVVVGQVRKRNELNSPSAFAVARFNLDGTPDVTFGRTTTAGSSPRS